MHCWKGVLVHTVFVLAQPTYLAVRSLLDPSYFSHVSAPWLISTAITWMYVVTQISIPFFTSPLRHLPSPAGDRLPIGHFDLNGGKPPTDKIVNMFRNTPNDGLLVLWYPFYLYSQVIPTRPDTLMDMLHTHSYDWEKPPTFRAIIKRTLGEGLVGAEGDQHKAMRRAVAPAFSGHHVRELCSLFYSKGLVFTNFIAREVKASADESLELSGRMSRVTLDIIGAAGIGKDFRTIDNDEDPFAKSYALITDTSGGMPLLSFVINTFAPEWLIERLKGTRYARVAEVQAQMRKHARALVQEKKQMKPEELEQQRDIIGIIMRSGVFSDDYLVDQLLTFLAAGHDTTASALMWTTYLLSLCSDVQTRLRAECDDRLANRPESDISASDFDAEAMPYLTAVCNEVLRLYPTIPATPREAVRHTKIGDQSIPKGTSALICPWAINRDKTLWGPDADTFDPDRWLEGSNAAHGGAQSHNDFLTFFTGPRSCIGREFARLEMKCLLATFVMRFKFDLADPNEKIEVGGLFSIKPVPGIKLRLYDLQSGNKA
ncbi:hypothetical protein LTR64_000682 [Lithohypha guttulata]|uniref:Cytochrome P450 n=1 Tax=Lithohypha guttulata TaxID=1690604 RepID=A0AAN7Y6W4_9EURO|nr:hypothetical protein LTR51_005549 [Lithohypha guttulata]KAK5086698.1 hypothetical protein LTR05_003866 [Lithohypha guttulata]